MFVLVANTFASRAQRSRLMGGNVISSSVIIDFASIIDSHHEICLLPPPPLLRTVASTPVAYFQSCSCIIANTLRSDRCTKRLHTNLSELKQQATGEKSFSWPQIIGHSIRLASESLRRVSCFLEFRLVELVEEQ